MTALAFDKRDAPAHLHPAQLLDEPTENGEHCGFCQGYPSKVKEGWFQVEYATGSDYSGSSVHRSNYRVLAEMLGEECSEGPVVWVRTPGGMGTYGLAVRYFELPETIRESIDALEDYCLLDESDHSELECDEQSEAWDNWAQKDFVSALAKSLGLDSYELGEKLTAEQWHGVFSCLCEASNTYWEDQGGGGPWIDLKRAVKAFNVGEVPKYASDHETEALEALFKALPTTEEA